jgi:hypothetical protein
MKEETRFSLQIYSRDDMQDCLYIIQLNIPKVFATWEYEDYRSFLNRLPTSSILYLVLKHSRVMCETSSLAAVFFERFGFREKARIADYYRCGLDRVDMEC